MNITTTAFTTVMVLLAFSGLKGENYTLEQCVRTALKNNPEIQTSEQQLKEAKSKINLRFSFL